MDVHASPASLPELDAFLSTFKVRFRRSEAQAALERYLWTWPHDRAQIWEEFFPHSSHGF
jgi:hypothetical protein